jgi:myo-inositol-1(or 4)-monophosphatase
MMDYLKELSVARQLAEQAGELINNAWEKNVKVSYKNDIEAVSEIDFASEKLILSGLKSAFPNDLLCGEESGQIQEALKHSGRVWFVDPLDGTVNFAHGLPHFCVCIALVENHQVQMGVIYEPIRQWCFYAIRGGGAWRNGKKLSLSDSQMGATDRLLRSVIATGFPYDRKDFDNTPELKAMLARCQCIRRQGSAALDLAYVASGWLNGYWEYALKPWDVAAGALLLQEAGGMVTDEKGGDQWLSGSGMVASTSVLHPQILEVISQVRSQVRSEEKENRV